MSFASLIDSSAVAPMLCFAVSPASATSETASFALPLSPSTVISFSLVAFWTSSAATWICRATVPISAAAPAIVSRTVRRRSETMMRKAEEVMRSLTMDLTDWPRFEISFESSLTVGRISGKICV